MPETPNASGALTVDMSDAPGGEEVLNQLFPAEETIAAPEAQPSEPAPEPTTAPEAPKVFLKTSTGTVYNTQEDAVRGTEHKDATIQNLRSQLKQLTGTDPLARKQVQQPEVVSYAREPQRYYDDTAEAVAKGDKVRFAQISQQFVREAIAEAVGPYVPVLQRSAVRDAQDSSPDDVRKFIRTDAYQQVLKEKPSLRNAIRAAEVNPQVRWQFNEETGQYDHDALPELYDLAYAAARAKTPVTTQPQAAPVAPTRPTLNPSHVGDVRSQVATTPSMATPEGRKAIIERARARGVEDLVF